MQIGECRFTFKCLSCGEEYRLTGLMMGTGNVSRACEERRNTPCGRCNAPVVCYSEIFREDYWDDIDPEIHDHEYAEAREAYLAGSWLAPEGYLANKPSEMGPVAEGSPVSDQPAPAKINDISEICAKWFIKTLNCAVWLFLLVALVVLIVLFIRIYFMHWLPGNRG